MNILITICARGGSKGIPKKNIRLLNGKPLIGYTIEKANEFFLQYDGDIVLSTDSDEIIGVCESLGLKTTYRRPKYLASDSAGKIETIKDVLLFTEKENNIRYDYVIDLDVTSPLRKVDDLKSALALIFENDKALNIFSVSQAQRNPYFNMVEIHEDGFYKVVKSAGKILSRQKAPKVYDMNSSFYIYKRMFFDTDINTTTTDFSLVYIMEHICFDLDEMIDFEFMEFLLQKNKLDFQL